MALSRAWWFSSTGRMSNTAMSSGRFLLRRNNNSSVDWIFSSAWKKYWLAWTRASVRPHPTIVTGDFIIADRLFSIASCTLLASGSFCHPLYWVPLYAMWKKKRKLGGLLKVSRVWERRWRGIECSCQGAGNVGEPGKKLFLFRLYYFCCLRIFLFFSGLLRCRFH